MISEDFLEINFRNNSLVEWRAFFARIETNHKN